MIYTAYVHYRESAKLFSFRAIVFIRRQYMYFVLMFLQGLNFCFKSMNNVLFVLKIKCVIKF